MRTADGTVIRRCLEGDPSAFGLLMDKYKASIFALAYSRLGNFHDAEDITQEVFLIAYRKLRSLRRWDSFFAWLYSITSNLCKKRQATDSRRPDRHYVEEQRAEVLGRSAVKAYQDAQGAQVVRDALRMLPGMYRDVLVLYYLSGMNSKEIAEFLGTPPATIRQRLHRARNQLRHILLGKGSEEEVIVMMNTMFDKVKLQPSFTFRVVEAVKRMKIQSPPQVSALPWGFSAAAGLMLSILMFSAPYFPLLLFGRPPGSLLPNQAQLIESDAISVTLVSVADIPILAGGQESGSANRDSRSSMQRAFAQPGHQGKWGKRADMPTPRSLFGVSAVNGKIYAIGGDRALAAPISTVEEYDPATDTWAKKADMPTTRSTLAACMLDGQIYAIGGWGGAGRFHSTVEVYDPVKDTWTQKADMPTARSGLAACAVNGKIYAIGGGNRNELAVVEEYDPATNTWTRKADMPTAIWTLAVGVVGGTIYAIGGGRGNIGRMEQGVPLSVVEAYDPVTDTWTQKADMPTTRTGSSASVVDGKIYVIGGGNRQPLSAVEMYDPVMDIWTQTTSMPTARWSLATCVVDGKIYAIGGLTPALAPTPVAEMFDPGTTSSQSVQPTGKLPTIWGTLKIALFAQGSD